MGQHVRHQDYENKNFNQEKYNLHFNSFGVLSSELSRRHPQRREDTISFVLVVHDGPQHKEDNKHMVGSPNHVYGTPA